MQVLIVKVSSLGDVVHCMPVVQDILRQYPDARIDWVVEEGFVDLLRLARGLHQVIPFALRRWRKHLLAASTWREIGAFRRRLREQRYDVVIDTQGLLKTGLIARAARGTVWGLGNGIEDAGYEWPVRYLYHHMQSMELHTHVVTRSRLLVAAALGLELQEPIDFGLDAARADHSACPSGRYAVFVHATSRGNNLWPEPDWIAVGRALLAHGTQVALPWGSELERTVSERLAAAMGPGAVVPPKLNLSQVVGLIDGAAVTVGVDTGLVHIAAALQQPTVELHNFNSAWRVGGFWSPHIIDLGDGRQRPTAQQALDALVRLGQLPATAPVQTEKERA